METINPKDLSRIDPNTISYITLTNGNMIVLDSSVSEKSIIEKDKNNYLSKIESFKKTPLKISEKIIISYKKNTFIRDKIHNINGIFTKNDFNIVSKIIKTISFSFLGQSETNLINFSKKENLSRNTIQNDFKNKIISISNTNKNTNTNNYEHIKNSNLSPNSNSNLNLNLNKYEENKESDSIRKIPKGKNYKERLEKLIGDINKPTVNAVISLDIPSDIPFTVSHTQRQFNKLITQLRRKKNRNQKMPGDENYQKYYELYKKQNNKIYNGTFNYYDKRIKYFEENAKIESDINEKETINNSIFNRNYDKDSIFYNNIRISKNINKNYNIKEINDYNSKNNTISYLFHEKKRALSHRENFRDRLSKRVKNINSIIIYPSNNYKNNMNNFKF